MKIRKTKGQNKGSGKKEISDNAIKEHYAAVADPEICKGAFHI